MKIVPWEPGIKVTTRKDAGRRLGVQKKWVARWIDSGELTIVARPPGVQAIILESSVDALLARLNSAATAAV